MSEGISLHVDKTKAMSLLGAVIKHMENPEPALGEVGEIGLESIQRNFEEGGRPTPWQALSPVTIKEREKIGKWPGRILVRRGAGGGLMGAINYQPMNKKVVWSANKVYAAIHHFGGQAGRGHKVTIPARPFMMIQDEDWEEIKAAMQNFIIQGRT